MVTENWATAWEDVMGEGGLTGAERAVAKYHRELLLEHPGEFIRLLQWAIDSAPVPIGGSIEETMRTIFPEWSGMLEDLKALFMTLAAEAIQEATASLAGRPDPR